MAKKSVKPVLAKKKDVPHIHHEHMAVFAVDAGRISEPWKLWEYRHVNGEHWQQLEDMPVWEPNLQYRRITRRGMVNGVEVLLGEENPPPSGDRFYLPMPADEELYDYEHFDPDDHQHMRLLDAGLVYLNKDDAIARAKAMRLVL